MYAVGLIALKTAAQLPSIFANTLLTTSSLNEAGRPTPLFRTVRTLALARLRLPAGASGLQIAWISEVDPVGGTRGRGN